MWLNARRVLAVAGLGAIGLIGGAAPAIAAPAAPQTLFENTGERCANFGVFVPVSSKAARALVPAGYKLPSPALALVEEASCPAGSLNGQPTGPYRIAEAAIVLNTPRGGGLPFPLGDLHLYMLWLLDSDPALAAAKGGAGYPGGVVDIDFAPPLRGGLRNLGARVGQDGGYTATGTVGYLANGLGFPQVNQQYQNTPAGVVRTTNTIYQSTQALAGLGTVTAAPGSTLATLFGKTRVSGAAIAGVGSYRNRTVLTPAPAP